MERTDESLLLAHIDGDSKAFAILVRRYADSLLGYLTRMLSDRAAAEDCFQETFQKVHLKADTFKPDGVFRTWLYGIATRTAIDRFRSEGRRVKALSLNTGDNDETQRSFEVADAAMNPQVLVQNKEARQLVRQAVASLPDRQRTALVLAYFQQMSYPQVAQVMGCSTGTVKTQIFRAVKKLAELLPDAGGVEL